MEESFELLSSMSPKVKGCQKHFRKASTLLALKKNVRRSINFDKSVHTFSNEELIIIEDSSTTDSYKSSKSQTKMLNKTPIVISDTDISDTDNDSDLTSPKREGITIRKPPLCKQKSFTRNLLTKDKLNEIEQWISKVNTESEIKLDSTTYSELSTIYGDETGKNFKAEGHACAVNSTFMGTDYTPFNKLFKNVKQCHFKTENVPLKVLSNAESKSVPDADESFNDPVNESFKSLSNKSLNTRLQRRRIVDKLDNEVDEVKLGNCSVDAPKSQVKSSTDISSEFQENKSNSKTEQAVKNNSNFESDESRHCLVSMLDDLYGNTWREKEEHVLPKTEPRKRLPKPNNIHITNTERKPKFSLLYKNPYLKTERQNSRNLLQNSQSSKLKINLKSPWTQRLNDLCDSDTESENSRRRLSARIKLNFDNDSDSNDVTGEVGNEGKASKYFKPKSEDVAPIGNSSDKENLDKSYLGDSLEEKIQKKINNVPDLPKSKNIKEKNKVNKVKKNLNNECGAYKNSQADRSSTSSGKSGKSKVKEKIEQKPCDNNSSASSEDEWQRRISKIPRESKPVNGKYSFLASLSANVPIFQCDMSARIYRNNFKIYKDQLLKKLFTLYNENIFDNAIPRDTVFEWSDRMRGTAGYCACKKITRKQKGTVERTVRIVLSTKVIDSAYRLRDTLVHEMCHAATWVVNCVSDGHGPYWKAWAFKAMKTFPELPPIKRCHEYVINTKYTYKCTGCGYSIGRHSKSLDIERKRCGYCKGKFEILINKTSKKGETKSVPATPKKEATGFALFVKENYGKYRSPQFKHGDVMKLLGQKFQEVKLGHS